MSAKNLFFVFFVLHTSLCSRNIFEYNKTLGSQDISDVKVNKDGFRSEAIPELLAILVSGDKKIAVLRSAEDLLYLGVGEMIGKYLVREIGDDNALLSADDAERIVRLFE